MFEQFGLVLATAVGFGLLVFVHELGHFLAAKMLKIRVEAFSLGFGPHLSRRWGGTDYRLSLVPLGGYVKLAGETYEAGRAPGPDEFFGRPVGQRVVVLLAGVFMNAVLAVVGFTVAFSVGVTKPDAVLGYVEPGGPAWRAGLQPGDRVVEVNGSRRYMEFTKISEAALFGSRHHPVTLVVERDGRERTFHVVPEYDPEKGYRRIGISPPNTLEVGGLYYVFDDRYEPVRDPEHPTLKQFAGCPALAAGLREGDVLLEANGVVLETAEQFTDEVVRNCAGRTIHLVYLREGRRREAYLSPIARGRYKIGVLCRSTAVKAVRSGSWAAGAGLGEGDVLTLLDGAPLAAPSQIVRAARERLERAAGGRAPVPLALGVRGPDGAERTVAVACADAAALYEAVHFDALNVVDELTPGFPAERQAGMQPGDRIVELGVQRPDDAGADAEGWVTTPVRRRRDLTEPIMESGGRPIRIRWERAGQAHTAVVRPRRAYLVGLVFKPREVRIRLGPVHAALYGTRSAFKWIPRFFQTIEGFFTGGFSTRHLGGPVNILRFTYRAARHGPATLAYFLAFISIHLALFNILPIPVLDGGHIFFALVEKMKGSPVSQRVQTTAAYVGLALLLTLLMYATFNDIFPRFRF